MSKRMPKQAFTDQQMLDHVKLYVNQMCGGNRALAARRLRCGVTRFYDIYNGRRPVSPTLARALGFTKFMVRSGVFVRTK